MTALFRHVPLLVAFLFFSTMASLSAQLTCLSDHQCADGTLCNGIERCLAGTCAPATAPLACDDGDVCTTDSCDPAAGCAHDNIAPRRRQRDRDTRLCVERGRAEALRLAPPRSGPTRPAGAMGFDASSRGH